MAESACFGKRGLLKLTDKDISSAHHELWTSLDQSNKFMMLNKYEEPILFQVNEKLALRNALNKKDKKETEGQSPPGDRPLFSYKSTSIDYNQQSEYAKFQAVFLIKQHELRKMSDLLLRKIQKMELMAKKHQEETEKRKVEKLILGRNSLLSKDRPATQGHYSLEYEIQGKETKQGVLPLYKSLFHIKSDLVLRYMLEFRNSILTDSVKMTKGCPSGAKIKIKMLEVSSGSHTVDEKKQKTNFKMVGCFLLVF
jgi:hypothetical protein